MSNLLNFLGSGQVRGDLTAMTKTDPRHLNSQGKAGLPPQEDSADFGNLVLDALGRVSEKQITTQQLFERMITHPDEVEPHEVTTAMAQAEMSLNMTKALIDRAVKAYNDIIALR